MALMTINVLQNVTQYGMPNIFVVDDSASNGKTYPNVAAKEIWDSRFK